MRTARPSILCAAVVAALTPVLMQAPPAWAQTSISTSPWSRPLEELKRLRDTGVQAAQQTRGALQDVGVQLPLWGAVPSVLPPVSVTIDPNQPLRLRQAWAVALVNDATLRAASAANQSNRERVPQARAQLLPSVQASLNRSYNDINREGVNSLGQPQNIFDRYNSSGENLTLRQPLVREAQRHQLRQAEFLVQDGDAALERERQNLAIRISGAYFEALLSRDQIDLVDTQRRFLTTQLDASERALAAGTGTRTDVDEARARLDLNAAQRLEAEQQLAYTRRQLQTLLNQPYGQLAMVDADLFRNLPPLQGQAQDWVDRGMQSSPEVRSLDMRRKAAQEDISRTRSNYLPTVDAVAQVQRSNRENANIPQSQFTGTIVGVQVNVPLFQGGLVSSTVRQAHAELDRATEQLEALKQDLGLRIHREHRSVTEGQARVRALELAARSAEVALDSARKSFAAGSRTSLDVLNAEQQRMLVMRDLSQARYTTLMAMVRLHALVGKIDEGLMAGLDTALR